MTDGAEIPSDDAAAEAETFKSRLKAAESGDRAMFFMVGYAYHYGEGVARDYAAAMRWYLKSWEADGASAYSIGSMYEAGEGVAKDYAAAAKWYRKDAGPIALYALGALYETGGPGLARDLPEAARHYAEAAATGFVKAQTKMGELHDTGAGVRKDSAAAMDWYKKASTPDGPRALGTPHRTVKPGTPAAARFAKNLERAAAEPRYRLAQFYLPGRTDASDPSEALYWLLRAARAGHKEAAAQCDDVKAHLNVGEIAQVERRLGNSPE